LRLTKEKKDKGKFGKYRVWLGSGKIVCITGYLSDIKQLAITHIEPVEELK
jgi:hypothetical protein